MSSDDVEQMHAVMLEAAWEVLGNRPPTVCRCVEAALGTLAVSISQLQAEHTQGSMFMGQAQLQLEMLRNTTRLSLYASHGLGVLAVEDALNAALGAVRSQVNTALGGELI